MTLKYIATMNYYQKSHATILKKEKKRSKRQIELLEFLDE